MSTATQPGKPGTNGQTIDRRTVAKWLRVFIEPSQVAELRCPDAGRYRTVSGYFDNLDLMAKAALEWSGKVPAVYFTINPCQPDLLARRVNRAEAYAKETTSDSGIICRRWFFIDFDPKRPSGISSTNVEHAAALDRAGQCRDWLGADGWPSPVEADSGNGAHLLYAIDLPNDEASLRLLEQCLKALAFRFSDARVDVDLKTANAARICKLYGTLSCKGDSTPDRPHRPGCVLAVPDVLVKVRRDLLEGLAATAADDPPEMERKGLRFVMRASGFDLARWIEEHNLPVVCSGNWRDGKKWVLNPCPWNEEHTNRAAFIVQMGNGKIGAGCHHNGCAGKGWADLRDVYEPGWLERRASWEGAQEDAKAQAAGTCEPEPWQEIIPLSEVPAVEPFPAHVLPGDLPDYLDGSAAALNCPPDYLGVPLLAVAGAAIGASRALEVKPGWTERPNLYAAVVGRPGTVKTAAQKTVCAPVYAEQKRLATEYRRRKQDWEKQDKDTRPPKPKLPTVYVSDVTTEKLAELLQDNPRGLALIRDELTAWVASLDQYRAHGRGSDRQFYLSAWAGEPVSVHRKNLDEPVFVPHPFVAVVGGLPPDLLANLRGERAVSDGFFDRILAVYPEPPPAAAETWASIPERPAWAWHEVMEFLRNLKPEPDGDGERPHFVRLDATGRKAWERFTAQLAADLNGDTLPDCLRGPWSKHRGYCARLALIVHCLRHAVGEVSGEDVDGEDVTRAACLIHYFQSHCRKVYDALEADPTVARAKRLWEWIVREKRTEFKAWEPHKDIKSRGEFPSVEALHGPLQRLERHSYIRPRLPADRRGPGRPPATVYEVNPLARNHRVNRVNPENAPEP